MQPPGSNRFTGPLDPLQCQIEHLVSPRGNILLQYPATIRMDDKSSLLVVKVKVPVFAKTNFGQVTQKIIVQQIDAAS